MGQFTRIVATLLVAVLTGCAIGPPYTPPERAITLSEDWRQPALTEVLKEDGPGLARWWEHFEDPELSRLAEAALSGNLGLAQARARILEAQAQRGVVASAGLPQSSAGSGYTRADNTSGGGAAGPPGNLAPVAQPDQFTARTMATWEPDFWGRVARLENAAGAEAEAAADDYNQAAVSLLAETALAYIDVRGLQARAALMIRDIALQEQLRDLAESRRHAGTGDASTVRQFESQLERSRAQLPELGRQEQLAENRLAVLLGRQPRDGLISAGGLPGVPPLPALGLPAQLLVRRADVRAAERRYASAFERTWAARAERYPTLQLSGLLRLQAADLGRLFAEGLFYSIGSSLQVPLDTGGRIEGSIALREAQAEGARLALESALLNAIRDTEDALAGVRETREQRARLEPAEAAAEADLRLAEQRYSVGLGNLFDVLSARRQHLSIETDQIRATHAALAETVRLYRALGGGWESFPAAMPEDSKPRARQTPVLLEDSNPEEIAP